MSLLKVKNTPRHEEGTYTARVENYTEQDNRIILTVILKDDKGKKTTVRDFITEGRVSYFLGCFSRQFGKQDEALSLEQLLTLATNSDFAVTIKHSDSSYSGEQLLY